jgi:K+-transporting ATPase ATPase C chain
MFKQLAPAFRMTALLTVVTGLIYPGVVTGVCHLLFRDQADGSLILKDGQVRGSTLLGQNFAKPGYFHTRPSAAGTDGYDATASSGSNFGPTSQKLIERMQASADQFRKDNPDYTGPIPADAITASGSGLDPDISAANAEAQAARVAKARGIQKDQLERLIADATQPRAFGLFGEPRINAVKLNLKLDRQFSR